jgi:type VI secretion system secreted protein Hcp
MAVSDYLLEIDGIKGESQDDKHKETIDIDSFSWGASNSGSMSSGTGGGTGKVTFQDINFTASTHKGSPLLMQSVASGKHISKAILYVRKSGGDHQEYYKITLTDVLVSNYSSGGGQSEDGVIPQEQFSLNFSKIEWAYAPQDNKGALGSPVIFKHDLKSGKSG